jgi:hypothetical protein
VRPGVVRDGVEGVFALEIVRAVVESLFSGVIGVNEAQVVAVPARAVFAAARVIFRGEFAFTHINRFQLLGQAARISFDLDGGHFAIRDRAAVRLAGHIDRLVLLARTGEIMWLVHQG